MAGPGRDTPGIVGLPPRNEREALLPFKGRAYQNAEGGQPRGQCASQQERVAKSGNSIQKAFSRGDERCFRRGPPRVALAIDIQLR